MRPDLEMRKRVRLSVRGEDVATQGGVFRVHRIVTEGDGRRGGGGGRVGEEEHEGRGEFHVVDPLTW